MRVAGIDEAGRGCVFGDLVVAAFVCEPLDDDALRAAGATDSKLLTPARRLEVRAALGALGTASVRRIPPSRIDAASVNALEEEAIAELVAEARPDLVVIDALGHPSALPAAIARILAALPAPLRPEVVCAPKADRDHPVCGAASIVAKTTRDALLAELAAEHGDLGSGYPHDPKTRAWIAAHARTGQPWPAFVRTKWSTVATVAQGTLF